MPALLCQSLALLGIAKRPFGLRADAASAHAGIVPAIKQAVLTVPLRIIDPPPRLAVIASGGQLTGTYISCPRAVMRLQTQSNFCRARGQLQQPVRQSAGGDQPAGTGGRLPKAMDRREQLVCVTPRLGKLAGASIGVGGLGGYKPFSRE